MPYMIALFFAVLCHAHTLQADPPNSCIEPDEAIGIRMKRDCQYSATFSDRSILYSYNSYGFRDRPYPSVKSDASLRILLTGAANLVGEGLNQDRIPSRILEQEMHKAGFHNVEVLNGSLDYVYSNVRYTAKFKDILDETHPAIVLYYLDLAHSPFIDLADVLYATTDTQGIASRISYSNQWKRLPSFFRNFFSKNPSSIWEANDLVRGWDQVHLSWRLLFEALTRDTFPKDFLDVTIRHLAFMKEQTEQHGGRFFLILAEQTPVIDLALSSGANPYINFVYRLLLARPDIDPIHIKNVFAESGFSELYLGDEFVRLNVTNLVFPGPSLFFNEEGTARFARRVTQEISQSSLSGFLKQSAITRSSPQKEASRSHPGFPWRKSER